MTLVVRSHLIYYAFYKGWGMLCGMLQQEWFRCSQLTAPSGPPDAWCQLPVCFLKVWVEDVKVERFQPFKVPLRRDLKKRGGTGGRGAVTAILWVSGRDEVEV